MAQKELGTCLGHITGKLYERGETVEVGPSKGATCIILSRIITSLLRTGVSEDTIDLAIAAGKDDFYGDDEDDDDDGQNDFGPDDGEHSEDSENVSLNPGFSRN